MDKLLLIALGGALGALFRYGLSGAAHHVLGASFPWGTLAANLLGCFIIGLLWSISEKTAFPASLSPFIFTGLIGALTTFSTYGLESIHLFRDGEIALGLANIVVSNVAGLLLVFAGFIVARYLLAFSS